MKATELRPQKRCCPSAFSSVRPRKRSCSDGEECDEFELLEMEENELGRSELFSCEEDIAHLDTLIADDDLGHLPIEGSSKGNVASGSTVLSTISRQERTKTTERESGLEKQEERLRALFQRDAMLRVGGNAVSSKTLDKLEARGLNKMLRAHLMRWLMLCQKKLGLTLLTMATAVDILYRFMVESDTPIRQVDLVTVTALWVGTKIHEVKDLSVIDLCRFLENRHSKREVVRCEREIVRCLNYQLVCSTDVEIAYQTMKVCSKDVEHVVCPYVRLLLDVCMLDADVARTYDAVTRGVACVYAALRYAGLDVAPLQTRVKRSSPSVEEDSRRDSISVCAEMFHRVLVKVCGRATSPVSVCDL